MRAKKCRVFPIEIVVRGYLTGTTNTSIWTLYQQGEREFFNTVLPDGLTKNVALPQPILTPTTKSAEHDEPLTVAALQAADYMTPEEWRYISEKALALFAYGQEIAKQSGLILVDTKYEFGKDNEGNILLIDECHTPDSSRYWLLDTYQTKLAAKEEPDNFDKELLRLWFRKNCNPYEDKVLPAAPAELIEELSRRYQTIYQRLTGDKLWIK
jgi:phosphoribosylaminoimidazole-succinocarboxamide synthase